MNRLLDLLRLIPGMAKTVAILIVVLGAVLFTAYSFGWPTALVLLAGAFLVWMAILFYNKIIKRKQRQDGLAFGKALSESHQGPTREELRAAVSDLGQKWQTAMQNLRASNIDIYQLPWYMLIGEPQSGKSTTLKFSGLRFPVGMEAISGGGGTRNCDWWFTEQGVILDTAGRFTFQEGSATDAAEWNHFLDLLARHRAYCPINGVILVIPADTLLADDKETRERKARNINDKLLHIQRRLAIRFPVYVMITKCDQVYGFVQFFNKLNADQQREMFGWSNPEEAAGFDLNAFNQSFGQIVSRGDQIRRSHLSQPHFIDDIDKTFIFPEEFRSLREPLEHYMRVIFESSVYKDPLLFRGYYFSSGMQEGQPIVKACRAMLQDGAMLERLENVFQKSRAFFVRDFYSEKVFPEEGLVRRAAQFLNKDRFKRRFTAIAGVAMLVAGLLFAGSMYWSLSKRLTRPMEAIDQAQSEMERSGSFFDTAEDRQRIYAALKNLRQGLGDARQQGFLVFLKSRQNALTERLDDTFAALYMDRVALGLFDQVAQQLRRFQLDAPPNPRHAETELDLLLNALAELKKWELAVARGEAAGFDPSIAPFLALAAASDWDAELAAFRGDESVAEEMAAWFRETHARASPKIRAVLIEEMVRRGQGAFDELHLRVADFYRNQAEMAVYQEKAAIIRRLTDAYEAIKETSVSPDDYHDKLMTVAAFFNDETQATMSGEGDRYLPWPTIVERAVTALGPAFADLLPDREKKSLLERAKSFGRDLDSERDKLAHMVRFVNQLLAIDASGLPDPRRDLQEGEQTTLGYPAEPQTFWDKVLSRYVKNYSANPSPYADIPDRRLTLNENLEKLFTVGADRVQLLNQIFRADWYAHIDALGDDPKKKRFEDAGAEFYDAMTGREQLWVDEGLKAAVADEDLAAPAPPPVWRRLVREFNRYSRQGSNFDEFTKGPERLRRTLDEDHSRRIRTIFFNRKNPVENIERYLQNAHDQLANFGQTLARLDALNDSDLARNKNRYLGSFPERRALQNLADIRDTPAVMESHRDSLAAWSRAALDAFDSRVRGANPCPECGDALSRLIGAYRDAGGGFPVRFGGQAAVVEVDTGIAETAPTLTAEDKLDRLIQSLEVYRRQNQLQRSFLRQKNLTGFIKDALAWADGVKKLRNGAISVRYKIEPPLAGAQFESLTKEFTLCEIQGALKARRLSLNSPLFTALSANESAEDDVSRFRLYNDSPGNRAQSRLRVKGGLSGVLAFALDGGTPNDRRDLFVKNFALPVNTGLSKVSGSFHLKTSAPLPPPPDWDLLTRR